jgi:hypothetical protein
VWPDQLSLNLKPAIDKEGTKEGVFDIVAKPLRQCHVARPSPRQRGLHSTRLASQYDASDAAVHWVINLVESTAVRQVNCRLDV